MASTPTRTGELCSTRVTVERPADGGRAVVSLSTSGTADRPVIRPMLLSADASGARVALVPDGALLLAGDAIAIEVHVGPGARLELVEPGGTVAYAMDGGCASWDVSLTLAPAARVVWAGEPFVVAEGADVRRRTRVRLGFGARLAMRETLVLGRHGERAGRLHQSTELLGANDVPMLVDELDVHADSSSLLLGSRRVIGSVLLAGGRLEAADGTRLDLESQATIVRRLADEAHRAVPNLAWREAMAQVAQAI